MPKNFKFREDEVLEYMDIILEGRFASLDVGQSVLAIHPKVNEIRSGTIIRSQADNATIQFENPELGTYLVKDHNIIPIQDSKLKLI